MARHRFFTLCPEILCAVGYDGFFKRVNPAFTETLGYADNELRRIGFIELIHGCDQELARAALESLIGNRGTREFELRCLCADGEEKWLAWRAKSYPEDSVIYAAARDITRQKQADEKLRKYNLELKELNCAAQAATRAKSEFLANVSHELRTPMTAILMIADMLRDGTWDAGQLEGLDTIERNGRYLLTLINEILDLSKIEAGKLTAECVPCSVSSIVDDVESLIGVRAAEKGLELRVSVDSSVPDQVRTDPTRLQQILINLAENSVKFTDVGEVSIRTRAEERDGSCHLHFEVTDTGIGMTPPQMEGLFRPFTQGDASTTRRFGGTGLGLSISQHLVRLMGGEISAVSEPGQGSTFRFWIDAGPVGKPAARSDERGGGAVSSSPTLPDLSGVRILLAEDYPDIRMPVAFTLRKAGGEVDIVENGQQAIEVALAAFHEGRPFDVVLMDMQMPLVDGYTATTKLRQAGYGGNIIAMTAHAMVSDRQKCLAVGCDDYLAKPINMGALIGLIRRSANRQHESHEEASTA